MALGDAIHRLLHRTGIGVDGGEIIITAGHLAERGAAKLRSVSSRDYVVDHQFMRYF